MSYTSAGPRWQPFSSPPDKTPFFSPFPNRFVLFLSLFNFGKSNPGNACVCRSEWRTAFKPGYTGHDEIRACPKYVVSGVDPLLHHPGYA